MARIRTFIAIDLTEPIRYGAETLQQQLASANISGKWVSPADMHITLHFLGEINERDVHGVCRAISQIARKEEPFALKIAGIGAFPNLRRPKTLWAGITEGNESLSRLHAGLRAPLEDLGVYRHEDRRYTPHLTLGRVKADEESDHAATELAKHREWVGGTVIVEEIRLYRSEPTKANFEYSLLGRGELLGLGESKPKKSRRRKSKKITSH